ncbi:hypothetical protein SAMN05444336_11269 [Albimonas donghaensis]|uniref:Pyridoxamine 5'-phosphate oxidase N-terminal domain-containing protein n=1 Tax=Albimonas donghaensis TaxID=356660 RepID=A0A1H3FEA1_9RHOB|nr:pyridoxamine 5'-phosphate oxidase family protein [Albimonas donghaensis]SDX89107.1 hypothetical protein SAMN05444336_11269 [Albimonas donghaensis]
MTAHYRNQMFGPHALATQEALLGRLAHPRDADAAQDGPDRLGPEERAFIESRDSFFMATHGETGWPYMQHRGGPPGFVRAISERAFAFPDFRGNRQYISVGALEADDRASFFFLDAARQGRLKLIGRARAMDLAERPDLAALLALPDYPSPQRPAKVERAMVVEVEAFEWNCPQHITPRFSAAEIAPTIAKIQAEMQARIDALEAALAARDG